MLRPTLTAASFTITSAEAIMKTMSVKVYAQEDPLNIREAISSKLFNFPREFAAVDPTLLLTSVIYDVSERTISFYYVANGTTANSSCIIDNIQLARFIDGQRSALLDINISGQWDTNVNFVSPNNISPAKLDVSNDWDSGKNTFVGNVRIASYRSSDISEGVYIVTFNVTDDAFIPLNRN